MEAVSNIYNSISDLLEFKKPLVQKRAFVWQKIKMQLRNDITWIVNNTYLKIQISDNEIIKNLNEVNEWTLNQMRIYLEKFMGHSHFHGYHYHWAFENGSRNDIRMKNDQKIKFIICGLFLTNYYISPWEKRSNYPWKQYNVDIINICGL